MDLPLICFIYSIFNNCFVNSKRKETKNRIMKYWNKDFFFCETGCTGTITSTRRSCLRWRGMISSLSV